MRKVTTFFATFGLLFVVIGFGPGVPLASADTGNLVGNPGFEATRRP